MIPIVSVVGKSGAGKTNLVEGLVKELKSRGYRVGTIKHDVHGFDIDVPGKDSWRHARAGSDSVLLSSPDKLALIKHTKGELSLEDILFYLQDVDIVLTEGYKRADKPKIEVVRRATGQELLCREEELIALATDEHLNTTLPQFGLSDFKALADFIEKEYLSSPEETHVSLAVDGKAIHLKEYPRQVLGTLVKGFVSTLRGGEKAKRILILIEEERQ